MSLPTSQGIEEAAKRLHGRLHETPVISSHSIDNIAGCEVLFKCEHLQKTGSFKSRGATNAVLRLKEQGNVSGVITHSSGNHGQGLAWAASSCGIPCCVVAPVNAPKSKLEAMSGYGARLELCGPTIFDRESTCEKFASELNFSVVPPYDHLDVIQGQGTIAVEIVKQVPDADAVFIAVGGGGMAAGVATYLGERYPRIKSYLVEPLGKELDKRMNGEITEVNVSPVDTIADGIRVRQPGTLCQPQLKKFCTGNVITVTNDEIRDAMKLIWTRTKQRVEPSAAVPLAGLLKAGGSSLRVKKTVIILCGGNVDLDFLP